MEVLSVQTKVLIFLSSDMSVASLTEKDRKDLEFIMANDFDWVALSFVREAKDIIELREILKANNCDSHIIAKIEKTTSG